jgi:glutathione reductase (NADPH)
VVIGSGAAGTSCARTLAAAGWRVTQADDDRWGGTCLWRGCIPKKSLYQSALTLRTVRDADRFGIKAEPSVDWQSVLAWKWHSQESYAGDQEALAAEHGIEVVKAKARFVSPDDVVLGDDVLTPDYIVVATGSRPVLLPIPGIEFADTSEGALHYPEVPASLAIVGGGFIALELAGIFASFGTKVTVLTRPHRILDMLDEDLADAAVLRLGTLGVRFVTGATVSAIKGQPGALALEVAGHDGTESEPFERVIVAVGRRPAVDKLDLEIADIETDANGAVIVDASLRSTNPKVWFVGDAAGGMMQTPVASHEGWAVAQSIDSGIPVPPDCTAVPITCFTIPQLATVGLSEQDAKSRKIPVDCSRITIGSTGAGIITGETDGFVRLVTSAETNLILGCQIAGSSAADLIYSAAIAMKAGMTGAELGNVLAVHPSFAEAVAWSG